MTSDNHTHSADLQSSAALRIVTEGAHEVRSQLAILLLEIGKLNHPTGQRLEADVQTTSATVNRLATLFKLTTAQALDHKVINLEAILRSVIQRAQLNYPNRSHRIEFEIIAQTGAIRGHSAFIGEAIQALVDNALRHTYAGSRINVKIKSRYDIIIDDDGPGLPLVVINGFGQPFVRGRGPTAGPGLGLAIVHQVARLHAGQCYVALSHYGGTCIGVRFGAEADDE
jgi:signal transduction histidine kinase